MESWEIEQLIKQYWEGKTSLAQEEKLRDFFKETDHCPPEWKPCKSMLLYFEFEKASNDLDSGDPSATSGKMMWHQVKRWSAVAAILLVVGATGFYGIQTGKLNSSEKGSVTSSNVENTKAFFIEMKNTVKQGEEDLNVVKRINALGMR